MKLFYEHAKQWCDLLHGRVQGRSVAVVGNAEEAVRGSRGQEIDLHDEVVRFNAGIPSSKAERAAIGQRTTVWAVGTHRILSACAARVRPELVLFMKLTAKGGRDWGAIRREWGDSLSAEVWPVSLELESQRAVGGWASSGFRVAHACATILGASSVSVYGKSRRSTRSWWHPRRRAMGLDGLSGGFDAEREFGALLGLGFVERDGALRWTGERNTETDP